MSNILTKKQNRVLEAIISLTKDHGYPPTVREIGSAVGLSSSSTVHAHLRTLEKEGYIKRDADLTRAMTIVENDAPFNSQIINFEWLPILGNVAAGAPLLAQQHVEGVYPVPKEYLGGAEGFILRVKGDSMIDDDIVNDDLVIVRIQNNAENGNTIVALIENEATVKRFYIDNNRIKLQPANSTMEPMYFDNIKIEGKVVGLIRKFN